MLALARMGASIVPPMPAFYNQPASVGDIVDHIVTRIWTSSNRIAYGQTVDGCTRRKASSLKVVRR